MIFFRFLDPDQSKQNKSSIFFEKSHHLAENPHENWRNQNLDIKTKSSQSRRSKTSILEPMKASSKPRVFMNANFWKKTKKSCPEITHNTCSFDLIFQLYAVCYLDSTHFKEFVDKNSSSEFIKLVIDFCKWSDIEVLLQQRQQLLHATFSDKITISRKILELDCYMSVIDMFVGLTKKDNSLYSVTEDKRCPACSHHSFILKTALPVSCYNLNLSRIDRSIRLKDQNVLCENCDVSMYMEIRKLFSPVITVDLDGMPNPNISIDQIQKHFTVRGIKYQLSGLIETTEQHFIAHRFTSK